MHHYMHIHLHQHILLQQSDEDVSQFDTRFTRQTPVDSPDDTSLSHSAELAFAVRILSFLF